MPTVDELLNNTIESQVCTIDPDTRVINVPACYKEFGVEADEKVNRIRFQCPKIVGDNIDLTTFNLYINYMNARGNYNAYLVDDVTVSGDNITFSWLLSRHVTEKSGTVSYIVCAKKSDDTNVLNEWNTKVATATVDVGLEATTVVEEQNADVIEQILVKLNSAKNADYAQNDPNAKDYIKNRPFYGKKGTRLRNTYEDWAAAGGDDGSGAKPILSFIINDEIYENITPYVYNGGYTKVYNIPSNEQPKYQVVAYVQNRRIICTLGGSSKEIENWSIYPPEETEEIHYLDPKYIEDMYYTEKGPVIENLGNTYEDWLKLVDGETTNMDEKVLSFLYDGKLYENVKPTYASSASVVIYTFGSSSSDTVEIQYTTKTISAFKSFSFVKIISKDDIVHKIPEKYYNSNSPFVITPTFNSDTETWTIDRTWDEIKAAVAKSENPIDYAISLNKTILSLSELQTTKNSIGEITDVEMYGVSMWPEIVEENMLPEGFGSMVEGAQYIVITCFANKDDIDFMVSGAEQTFPIFKFVKVTKSDDGILSCNPPNTVELYDFALNSFDPMIKTSFICPLYYDGETYHYESTEKDSSNVTSIYFSTVSNGIYKRLKITQGRNAPDTVVMDKEIELAYLDNVLYRQTVASGTIKNASLDYYSRIAFKDLCKGTRNAYLTLSGDVESEYELEPGGFYDGIYSLNYNGTTALSYSIRSTSTHLGFVGDIGDIIDNNSKITKYKLSVDQFNYSVLPRNVNSIDVDGTTIKHNDQGQLTLAQEILSGTDISLNITGATVGQTVKISAVDANGVPTAWVPVDMTTGGGECGWDEDFELIIDDTVPANATGYTNDKDINGESFALRELVLILWTPAHTDDDHGNVGRGVGFIPASKWGVALFNITNTIKKSDGIGKYDILHIKVVNGYQMQLLHTRSQNTTNVFGTMLQDVTAGNAPINFKTDATALFEPSNATGYATCVKIAGYVNECVPAGTRIKLYGKRVKS